MQSNGTSSYITSYVPLDYPFSLRSCVFEVFSKSQTCTQHLSLNMSAPSSSHENGEIKHDDDFVEKVEPTLTHATYYPTNDIADLTPAHREYLLEKYGTLELDPIPDFGDADPYNWPSWKVRSPTELSNVCCLPGISAENHQPTARRLPRHDGHLYCCVHSGSIHTHRRRSWCEPYTSKLPNVSSNSHPWRSTAVLETVVQPLRTTAHIPHFSNLQSR